MIYAPFTPQQVEALNRWQSAATVHPFTCGDIHDGNRNLVAREDGWHCETCGYRQKWAHQFMLDPPPQSAMGIGLV